MGPKGNYKGLNLYFYLKLANQEGPGVLSYAIRYLSQESFCTRHIEWRRSYTQQAGALHPYVTVAHF